MGRNSNTRTVGRGEEEVPEVTPEASIGRGEEERGNETALHKLKKWLWDFISDEES